MAFGRKTGSLKKLKETLAKGGGSGFIKFVPKNGELNVRFIQEPEEWVSYMEHYDVVLKASYPCSGETSCPGCISGERKSNRYLANVVNLDDKDQVVPMQLPKDLANRLVIKYEKWGTLTDRDIELSRTGEGLDTTYDFDAGAVDRKSIQKYIPLDLLKTLEDVYNGVFPALEDEDDDDKPVAATRGRAKTVAGRAATKAKASDDDEPDDDDEPEDEVPKRRGRPSAAATRSRIKAKPVDDDDDEPEPEEAKPRRTRKAPEPEPEPDEEDDEDGEDEEDGEEYTEDDLQAMTLGQVRAVAKELEVETRGLSKADLIEAILDPTPF